MIVWSLQVLTMGSRLLPAHKDNTWILFDDGRIMFDGMSPQLFLAHKDDIVLIRNNSGILGGSAAQSSRPHELNLVWALRARGYYISGIG